MRRSSCGTTLIEIIVAVVIFGVLMLSGMSFFSLANQSQANTNKLIKAIELCSSVMEQTKTFLGVDDLTNSFPVTSNGQEGTFYVTVENSFFPSPPGILPKPVTANAKMVHVSVTWPDQGASVVDMYSIFSTFSDIAY